MGEESPSRTDVFACSTSEAAAAAATVRAVVAEIDFAIRTASESTHLGLAELAKVARNSGERLARDEVGIALVGEIKAGKSTFANALLGSRLLGVASRELTGTITFLRFGAIPKYNAVFTDGHQETSNLCLAPGDDQVSAESVAQFAEDIRQLTDMDCRAREVCRLEIEFPARWLPPGVVIVDTPGLNTSGSNLEELTWHAVEADADACLVLTTLRQAMSLSTQAIVDRLQSTVWWQALALTMEDQLRDLPHGSHYVSDCQSVEAVEVARMRYANSLRQSPEAIVSIVVSAHEALSQCPEGATRFGASVTKLFDVITSDRACIVVGTCVIQLRLALARSISILSDAITARQTELATIDSQLLPEPDGYCFSIVQDAKEEIRRSAHKIKGELLLNFESSIQSVRTEAIEAVELCDSRQVLDELMHSFNGRQQDILEGVAGQLRKSANRKIIAAARELGIAPLRTLHNQYQLMTHEPKGAGVQANATRTDHGFNSLSSGSIGGLDISSVNQGGGVASGVMAGVAIGLIVPVIGPIVGGLLGGLFGRLFGGGLDDAKRECRQKLTQHLDTWRDAGCERIEQTTDDLTVELTERVWQRLDAEVCWHREAISVAISSQKKESAVVRSQLENSQRLLDAFIGHEQKLALLQTKLTSRA